MTKFSIYKVKKKINCKTIFAKVLESDGFLSTAIRPASDWDNVQLLEKRPLVNTSLFFAWNDSMSNKVLYLGEPGTEFN